MSDAVRRVAVTGAAGYVAGGLIRRLQDEDGIERVLAIDVRPPTDQYTPKVVFLRHDVTEPMAEAFAEHGIEAVVHLAFVLNPGHDRSAISRINVGGTGTVLDACARSGVRHVVYMGSTTVYGAHRDNPPLLTEDSPLRPVDGFQYGEDKARNETQIRELTQRSPAVTATVLRTCPVLGPNAANFIARAFSRPVLVGVRGYDPPIQLVHEEDITEIMRLCLLERVHGVYNVAGPGDIRWSEMARMSGRRLIKLPAPVLYSLTQLSWFLRLQGDSPATGLDFIRYRWTVSTEKIERDLGVRFRHSSKETWESFVRRHSQPEPAR